jgi:diacylglycerol kinase (ATP)
VSVGEQERETHGLSISDAVVDVIVNPAAGAGRAGKRWPAFERGLAERGIRVRAHMTTGAGDALHLARRIAERGGDLVACVGGDGTVNEVVNGLLVDDQLVNPATRLAVISCGTGKDLSRTLGTHKPEEALDALAAGTSALVDVGRIQYLNPRTEHLETRYFANVADAGIGAAVAERINASSKRLGGLVSYLSGAVRTIGAYRPWDAIVEIDGEVAYAGPVGMVVFANGRYFGGGMLIAPDASLCDGALDIFILEGTGRRPLLTSLLPRVYRGKHVGQPAVRYQAGSRAAVRAMSTMSIELDGEQLGTTPLSVEIVPRALRVIGAAGALALAGRCADDGE